jgi:hypothetical protein
MLATWKAEIGGIMAESQPGQKVLETPFQPIVGSGDGAVPFIPTMQEA